MMRRCIQLLLCLVSSTALFAQDTLVEKWDIIRCVDYAMKNNISVRQTDLQSRYSSLTYTQSKAAQIPSLNVGGSAGFSFGRPEDPSTGIRETINLFTTQLQLQSRVNLFNWFSQKNSIESNRLNWEADKEQTNKLKNDVALNVAAAYLQILLAKEQLRISQLQVTQTETQLELTRKRVDAGALPELNAAELEAQLARDNSTEIASETAVLQYILQMKALLNLDAATPFDIVTPPVDKIPVDPIAELLPENVYALALANMPQQKVNSLRIQSAHKAIAAAKGTLYPTLSAYGSLGTLSTNRGISQFSVTGFDPSPAFVTVGGTNYLVYSPNYVKTGETKVPIGRQYNTNFEQGIGLSLSIPIFNGRTARTSWDRSKLNLKSLELEKEQSDMQLKQDIYTAYNDAVKALELYNANKKSEETAKKAYDYAQKRYDANLLSIYDLVNSRNYYRNSLIQSAYAQFDYLFKMKVLEFYKGQGIRLQ